MWPLDDLGNRASAHIFSDWQPEKAKNRRSHVEYGGPFDQSAWPNPRSVGDDDPVLAVPEPPFRKIGVRDPRQDSAAFVFEAMIGNDQDRLIWFPNLL